MTAGAHLVFGHRARSALGADVPIPLRAFTMAEPWVLDLKAPPVLGHLFSILVGPSGLAQLHCSDQVRRAWTRMASPIPLPSSSGLIHRGRVGNGL